MKFFIIFFFLLLNMSRTFGLTIVEFVHLAKKNDPSYKHITNQLKEKEYLEDLALPNRDITLEIEQKNTHSHTQLLPEINAYISKDIPSIGASFQTMFHYQKYDYQTDQTVNISYSQNLYGNFLGKKYTLMKNHVELEKKTLTNHVFLEIQSYLTDIIDIYINCRLTFLDMKTAKNDLNESEKLLKLILQKKENDIADNSDVLRSRLNLIANKEYFSSLKTEFLVCKNHIYTISSAKLPDQWRSSGLEILNSVDTDIIKSYDNNPKSDQIQIDESKITRNNLKRLRNNSLPEVNLIAGLSLNQNMIARAHPDSYIGINFIKYFGQSSHRAEIQQITHHLESLRLNRDSYHKNRHHELKKLHLEIRKIKKSLLLGQSKLDITKSILKEDRKRYKSNTIDLSELIESKTLAKNAHFEVDSIQLELYKKIVEWLAYQEILDDFFKNTPLPPKHS